MGLKRAAVHDGGGKHLASEGPGPTGKGTQASGTRDRLIIAGCLLVCLLPFIDKAFHLDDPMFLWAAQHIQHHPFNFYDFTVNWTGSTLPIADVMKNPPLVSYYLALVGSLFGWGETTLHLFFLLPAIGVALGTYSLARSFCSHPLVATLAGILSPVFLVSATTLMSDVLMLCGWVWSIVFWLRGMKNGTWSDFLLASILIPLTALTKYFGMCLIPLLLLYTVIEKRRLDPCLLWLLLPVASLAGYQHLTHVLYDRGLLFDAASYATSMGAFSGSKIIAKIFVALAFTGGCYLTLLFFAPLLTSRRIMAVGMVFGVILGVTFFYTGTVLDLMEGGRIDWDLIQPELPSPHWGVLVQFCLMIVIGIGVLALASADFLRLRNSSSLLLSLWVLGTFLFASFFNWTTNGRAILPLVPAAGILLVRRMEGAKYIGQQSADRWKWGGVFASAAFAMLVSYADYSLANSARRAALDFSEEYQHSPSTIWIEGHWGFQYYMGQHGAKELEVTASRPVPDDVVLVPYNNCDLTSFPQIAISSTRTRNYWTFPWLSCMHRSSAGFYSDRWGPLPFAFGADFSERYYILTLRGTMQLLPAATPGFILPLSRRSKTPLPKEEPREEMESLRKSVEWKKGPGETDLGNIAQVRIPPGYVFAGGKDARRILQAAQNPPSEAEVGFLAPDDLDWFVVFEFLEIGYVKDESKQSLGDPGAILKVMNKDAGIANPERRKRGWPELTVTGWGQEPYYDSFTNSLQWAVRGESAGKTVINYNRRSLGRSGVMRITLVADPSIISATVPKFNSLMEQFSFKPGYKYSDYRKGDEISGSELTELMVSREGAVDVKSGGGRGLWKVIIPALLGIGLFLKKFVRPQ